MAALLAALGLLALLGGPARAHQSSVKYVAIAVDGAAAEVRVTLAPADLTEPLGLPPDAQPTAAEVLAAGPAAAAYVARWLAVGPAGGAPCAPGAPAIAAAAEPRFLEVTWRVACPSALADVGVDLAGFFAVDARHEAVVRGELPGGARPRVVARAATPRIVLAVGAGASVAAWIGHGLDHIYGGLDHVAFVLALLLVVVLARTPDGWAVRRPLAALRQTAVVVTAFTVAHSASLIAASLGWIALPSRLVESVIAASIVYTAVEDIVRPDAAWRFGLTCAFGLVHGLGFASMLAALLPPGEVVAPLLLFNVGVELGQLTIVAIALPLLWGLARALGAERYRRTALPAAAGLLALVGVRWLLERALGLTM